QVLRKAFRGHRPNRRFWRRERSRMRASQFSLAGNDDRLGFDILLCFLSLVFGKGKRQRRQSDGYRIGETQGQQRKRPYSGVSPHVAATVFTCVAVQCLLPESAPR